MVVCVCVSVVSVYSYAVNHLAHPLASRLLSRLFDSTVVMPRIYKKRGGGKSRAFKRAAPTRKVRAAPRAELKWHDTLINKTDIDTLGLTPSLNQVSTVVGIAQGVTETERIGRKITVTHLSLRGAFVVPASLSSYAADSVALPGWGAERVRMIVYIDKQNNSAGSGTAANGPSLDSILEFESGAGAVQPPTVNAFRNLEQMTRYTVLKDVTLTLNSAGEVHAGSTSDAKTVAYQRQFSYNFKLRTPILFKDGTADAQAATCNQIGIWFLKEHKDDDGAAGTQQVVQCIMRARVRYYD